DVTRNADEVLGVEELHLRDLLARTEARDAVARGETDDVVPHGVDRSGHRLAADGHGVGHESHHAPARSGHCCLCLRLHVQDNRDDIGGIPPPTPSESGNRPQNTLPGLRMPRGSKTALICRWSASWSSPNSVPSQRFLRMPTPCSPVSVPPSLSAFWNSASAARQTCSGTAPVASAS